MEDVLIGAAISFVQMGAYAGIHQAIGGIANATVAATVKVGLHAVVGGAVSVAQGGSFETGALTGAVAAGSSLLMDSSGVMGHSGDGNPEYIAERTAVSAIAGGTASVLSGGKFANGAITGAFAQLYNAEDLFNPDTWSKSDQEKWYQRINKQHRDGVEHVASDLSKQGYELVGGLSVVATEVPGFSGVRYYDLIVRALDGTLVGVEVKTTSVGGISLDQDQVAKDVIVATKGGKSVHGSVSGVMYKAVGFGPDVSPWIKNQQLNDALRSVGAEPQSCTVAGCRQ